jgi:shikimate dehydrogenase
VTRLYGLLGHPVGHSRSPSIWSAAFREAHLDAAYLAFDVPAGALGDAVRGLAALGAGGFNVTLPHKRAVITHLDHVEARAVALGAVNAVVREAGRWVGLNTDAPGLVRDLTERGVTLDGADVLVLGAGGAARAAVLGVAEAGAARVRVAARRLAQAEALVADLEVGEAVALSGLDPAGATLWIQATSATLASNPAAAAFAEALPLHRAERDAVVVDLVYAPLATTVLRRAEGFGLRTLDGLGMLVGQAALAFERFTAHPAPLRAMRAAALKG